MKYEFAIKLLVVLWISFAIGQDLEERSKCLQYRSCNTCIGAPDCGWCSSGKCVAGNSTGPFTGSCPGVWEWVTCNGTTTTTTTTGAPTSSTGTTGRVAFQFMASQLIAGMTVVCAQVTTTPTYTECDNLNVDYPQYGPIYFPNGVTCSGVWSNTTSPYTDTGGFCKYLTGGSFEVYYTCSDSTPRAIWKNNAWDGIDNDNGFSQSLRCFYPQTQF